MQNTPPFATCPVPAIRNARLRRERACRVVTLACDFDVFASGIPASFAAILLAGWNFTGAWDVCALGFVLIIHLKFLLFRSLLFSIRQLLGTHHSLHFDRHTPRLDNSNIFFPIKVDEVFMGCLMGDTPSARGQETTVLHRRHNNGQVMAALWNRRQLGTQQQNEERTGHTHHHKWKSEDAGKAPSFDRATTMRHKTTMLRTARP